MGIQDVKFKSIVDYLILICASLSYTKSELEKVVDHFESHVEELRKALPTPTYHKVIGTDVKSKIGKTRDYIHNLDKYLSIE